MHIQAKNPKKEEKINDCINLGYIYGAIYGETGGYPSFIPLAKVKIDGRPGKLCGMLGGYCFIALPLGRSYTITADANGYQKDSKTVSLTKDKKYDQVLITLLKDRDTSTEEQNCKGEITGTVFGEIGGFQDDIAFADIEIIDLEAKKTGLFGGFRFSSLQFNKEYNLTADAYGYFPNHIHVTLTKENPTKHVLIVLDQDIEERAKIKNMKIQNIFRFLTNKISFLKLD